jgi:hypothetical protein
MTGSRIDIVVFHKLHDVFKRRILRHGTGVEGHDFSHLATPFVYEVRRNPARTQKELQPATALSLSPDLGAADEVALRDDADQLSGFVDDRQAAYVIQQHGVCRLGDIGVGSDSYNRSCHDLMRTHFTIS